MDDIHCDLRSMTLHIMHFLLLNPLAHQSKNEIDQRITDWGTCGA